MLRLLAASSAHCSGIHVTPKSHPSIVAGLTATCGHPQFKDFMPAEDGLAVTRSEDSQPGIIIVHSAYLFMRALVQSTR